MSITSERLVTVLAATVTGLVGWAAEAGAGVDLDTASGKVTPAGVLVVGLLVGGLAWLLLAVLERVSRTRGRTIWTVIASVVLVISLAGPLGATTTGAKLSLLCLHLLVGGVLIVGMRRRAQVDVGGQATVGRPISQR